MVVPALCLPICACYLGDLPTAAGHAPAYLLLPHMCSATGKTPRTPAPPAWQAPHRRATTCGSEYTPYTAAPATYTRTWAGADCCATTTTCLLPPACWMVLLPALVSGHLARCHPCGLHLPPRLPPAPAYIPCLPGPAAVPCLPASRRDGTPSAFACLPTTWVWTPLPACHLPPAPDTACLPVCLAGLPPHACLPPAAPCYCLLPQTAAGTCQRLPRCRLRRLFAIPPAALPRTCRTYLTLPRDTCLPAATHAPPHLAAAGPAAPTDYHLPPGGQLWQRR